MEGEDRGPLPSEDRPKGAGSKTLVIVVALVIVLAVVLGAVFFLGWGQENKQPVAGLSASSDFVSLGTSVVLNGSASSDADGSVKSYEWHLGNGVVMNTTTDRLSYTYPFPGKYIVVLIVEDDQGSRASTWSDLVRIEVTNPPNPAQPDNSSVPFALAAASDDMISDDQLVSFDAGASQAWSVEDDGEGGFAPVRDSAFVGGFSWTFGDGSAVVSGDYEEAKTVNHTFSGQEELFGTYVLVSSVHGATQRYYLTIALPPAGSGGSTQNTDVIVDLNIGEPESLDPAYDYETAGGEVLQNVYETLVWYDGASAIDLIPMLATNMPTKQNGGISADGLNYTFYLKQGVHFHHTDGVDWGTMTAEDVEYSIERVIMMNDGWSPAWMLGQVMIPNYYDYSVPPQELINQSVEVVNDYTVVLHLAVAYPAFISVLTFTVGSIICKDFVEAHGGVVRGEPFNEYLNTHTCGTGPYFLKEWVYGQHWMLERFEDYHRGPAPTKYVLYRKVEDVGTREMILFAGQADICYIPRQHILDVRGKEDILRIVEGYPTFNIDFVGFNQNIPHSSTIDQGNVTSWFFQDENVRRAFVHCFDTQTFIDEILQGTGITPNGIVPLGMFGYNASIPTYEFDLELAAQYLKAAFNNVTGKSWADQGFRITLFYNAGNSDREAACALMADGLEKLSVQGLVNGTIMVDVQALDWAGAYLPAVRGKLLPIFFLGWGPDYPDPDDYTQPFYRESGTYALRISLKDHNLTAMVDAAAYEQDEEVREQIYEDIGWHVYENAYFLWLSQTTNFHVERKWMQGWYFNPMYASDYFYVLSKS
jgi:peptide/nickel transport system substrate-binding protein